MNERQFQTRFNQWLIETQFEYTAVFELKITKTNSLPFSQVYEHQINALLAAKHQRFAYKISDISLGMKPFDSFMMFQVRAFVVILYYKGPKKLNTAYMIDVDDFIKDRIITKRKSLLEHRALAIATKTFIL